MDFRKIKNKFLVVFGVTILKNQKYSQFFIAFSLFYECNAAWTAKSKKSKILIYTNRIFSPKKLRLKKNLPSTWLNNKAIKSLKIQKKQTLLNGKSFWPNWELGHIISYQLKISWCQCLQIPVADRALNFCLQMPLVDVV